MTLQDALKDLMERQGANQVQLAERSGVTQSYISSLLRGEKNNPGATILAKLSMALKRDPGYLNQFLGLSNVADHSVNTEEAPNPGGLPLNKTCIQLVDSPSEPALNTSAAPLSPGPGVDPESSGLGALTEHNTNAKEAY